MDTGMCRVKNMTPLLNYPRIGQLTSTQKSYVKWESLSVSLTIEDGRESLP